MQPSAGEPDSVSGLLLGFDLPHYKTIRRIGSGGMGEVFLAEDVRLRRPVAIKRIRGDVGSDTNRRKLMREARAAARLNHPGIATIFDVLEAGDRTYIVMEFVEGESLADLIQHSRLPVSTAIEISLQMAEAIGHAYHHGIIHRDLKPANVHVTPDGTVKILDFGIAKDQHTWIDQDGTTAPETDRYPLAGTPAYMSPEQLMQRPLDPRTDIYSLGVIMFEMLSGRRPFMGAAFMELAAAILKEPPPSLKELRPDIPEGFRITISRAISKSRDERQPSMSALRDELQAVRKNLNSRMARQVPGTTTGNTVLAILPFHNLTGDPADDFISAGVCDVLIASTAGLNGITILSRASVSRIHETDRNLKRIAKRLGANCIVDGSYQRFGERIRVNATLVEVDTDRVIWQDQRDGDINSVFEIQTALSQKLRSALAPDHCSQTASGFPTESIQAFTNYAQARVLLERKDVPGNLQRTIELLEEALSMDPQFAMAHAALGETYWEQYHQTADAKWPLAALSSLAEALRLDPNQHEVRRSMARIYSGMGRNERALEELNRALEIAPASDETHRNLGNVLFDLGKRDEALEHFEQAIRLRPNFWENHRELGKAWYRMGQYDRAIVSFSRVTQLQPDSAWGFLMLGTTYHAIGEIELALYNYERSTAISPSATAATNMGTIWYGRKNYVEALKYYELATQIRPNKPLYYRNRGDAYLRLGETERAHESYERARQLTEKLIRVNPKDAEELSRLSVYEAKLGLFDLARRHAAEASRYDPLRVEIAYRSGVVHALAGEMEAASSLIKVAVDRGFSFSIVRQDDDLQELRKSKPFIDLYGRISEP
jgi:serine/threonine protein kinase/tetratricopeptide (TPR) repeat protein